MSLGFGLINSNKLVLVLLDQIETHNSLIKARPLYPKALRTRAARRILFLELGTSRGPFSMFD